MKKTGFLLFAVLLLIAGCTLMVDKSPNGGDFWLKMGDGTNVSASDIDYYDARHIIFLKNDIPCLGKAFGDESMSVYVSEVEIYKCTFHSLLSSSLPTGAFIYCDPSFYANDIIYINFMQMLDLNGKPQFPDPRSDKRIIAALKNKGLYHEGLRCEIQSVNYSNGKLVLSVELSNPDSFDYYYLDPDKMGFGLFHYFTNGPCFWNNSYTESFTHHETVIHPEPWNLWESEWLSLIKSGERKNISITYQHFDNIPAGNYKMYFSFPGLNKLSKKERELGTGRIWIGDICVWKDITIN